MADNAQKLAMVNQLVDHTNQALQNPGDEKQKSKLLSSTIVVALNSATSVLQQVGALDDRVQVVEAAVADKITRDEAQRMMERFASEAQKAQRKASQDVLREAKRDTKQELKAVKAEIKELKAQMARGTKRSGGGADGAGTSAAAAAAAKKPRNEYDAAKYTFIGQDGTEKTMATAGYDDIKELHQLVKAAKEEPGRITNSNTTLTPKNLSAWRIAVDQARVPCNKASGRRIHLSTFLAEGNNKAAQAMWASGEVEAVRIN